MKKKIPIFEKRIFWDMNFELIDYDAKANFVISEFSNVATWRISDNAVGITEMKR